MEAHALAQKVENHENRISKLEKLAEILIEKSIQLHQEMQEFKKEMQEFKEEMRAWRERSEKEMKAFKEEMRAWREQSEKEMQAFKEEMRAWRERSEKERQAFKEEMRAWREKTDKEMAQFRKQWGELANRLGTLAEDIVAPGLPHAIKKYFGLPVEKLFARVDVRKNGKGREYDVIAVSGDKIFVVDVKSQYRTEYFKRFKKMLEEFFDWFPEFKGKKIIPVIASFNLSPEIIKQATKRKCLALQMGGEYLEFVNADKLKDLYK